MVVETHSHRREGQSDRMAIFLSSDLATGRHARQGLPQPHTDAARVTGTGTLPPPRCGKGPTAVGESVMALPGSLRHTAARLTGKGSERVLRKRAARVVRGWESQPHGERRQGRTAFDFTAWKRRKARGIPITGDRQ
jgi:hypothetical protein